MPAHWCLDILPTGAVDADPQTPLPKDGYRWVHWDRAAPELSTYLEAIVPPTISAALTQQETRPRAENLDEGSLLILRGVNLNDGEQIDDMVSVRLWISRDLIISVRVRRVFALEEMRTLLQTASLPTSAVFVTTLANRMIDRIETQSLTLSDTVFDLEEQVFDEPDHGIDHHGIAQARRRAIRFLRFMNPQSAALHDFARNHTLLSKTGSANIREIANRCQRTVEELQSCNDRLRVISDHVIARQSARQGRNGYALSIVAAIFLPLGFLTGLFGINVGGMPWAANPLGFGYIALISLAMTVLVGIILRLFKLL